MLSRVCHGNGNSRKESVDKHVPNNFQCNPVRGTTKEWESVRQNTHTMDCDNLIIILNNNLIVRKCI